MKQTKIIWVIIFVLLISITLVSPSGEDSTSNSSNQMTIDLIEETNISQVSIQEDMNKPKQDYIIKFKDSPKKILNTNQESIEQYKIKHDFRKVPFLLIEATDIKINNLRTDPKVESIEVDQNLELFGTKQTIPWGINKVNAPNVWNDVTGKNIKIAVIDSGIKEHEDLSTVGGVSFIDNTIYYDDELGHGTSIAGVIAAQNNEIGIVGAAPDSELYSVKVIDSIGKLSDLLKGIEWSIENSMDIIVISLGVAEDSPALKSLVDEAYLNGILVIAASGKDGQLYYPAKYSSVIAVGSVDENNELGSDTGNGEELEFVAPGENILSTNTQNDYEVFSGTSMAAPHVAGVAALLKEDNPNLTPNELRAKLQRDAVDLGDEGKDNYFGFGLVNILLDDMNLNATINIIIPESIKDPNKVEIIKIEGSYEKIVHVLFFDYNEKTIDLNVIPGEYIIKQYYENITYDDQYNVSEGELVVVSLHHVSTPVHQWISYQASKIWSTSELNNHIEDYSGIWGGTDSYLDNDGFGREGYIEGYNPDLGDFEGILIGSGEEDMEDCDCVGYYECDYHEHFWDPDVPQDGDYNLGIESPTRYSCPFGLPSMAQHGSAYNRAQYLWDNYVIPNYPSNKAKSYYYLGRISHLLTDMTVPAHVHNDLHALIYGGDESFEDTMEDTSGGVN